MPTIRKSTTSTDSLDKVTDTLIRQEVVDGLLLVGSASKDELTSASDYDLIIVLSEMPEPLHVGTTYIDRRFTDLVFFTTDHVDQFLMATEPFGFWDWVGRFIGFCEAGKILFDRHGRLDRAQTKAQSGEWIEPDGAHEAYQAWNRVNYNLQVVRRYLTSDDPLYLQTADIKMMLYGPQDLFFSYFTIRQWRWEGEKAAVRYLQDQDPGYLARFNRFLSEQDRNEKYRLYEELAALTVAPVGRLINKGESAMIVDGDPATPDREAKALDFWEDLVAEPTCPKS
ncbi:MAG: hypothetical protein AAF702_18190 [Chloroflexota bacterium]